MLGLIASVSRSDIDLLTFGTLSYLFGGPSYEIFHLSYLLYNCQPPLNLVAAQKLRSEHGAGQSVPRLAQNVDTV